VQPSDRCHDLSIYQFGSTTRAVIIQKNKEALAQMLGAAGFKQSPLMNR
jgi:hypothetical protein